MNNEDVKIIYGFINRLFNNNYYIKSKKNKILKEFNEKFIKNKNKKIRFKNLPIQKQYEIIKYLSQIHLDDWYYKRLLNLIIRLYDQSIDEQLTKLLLNEDTPYPITILKNTNLTIDLLQWLIQDYKRLKYSYIKELITDKKLKQEFEELYKFLTL